MIYAVSTKDLSQITLGEQDTVRSILQNIRIILLTRQGTVPLYRDFGLSTEFLDKPMPVVKPLLTMEIEEAVSKFEPRATVVNVTFEEDVSAPGRLIPTVEVEINE